MEKSPSSSQRELPGIFLKQLLANVRAKPVGDSAVNNGIQIWAARIHLANGVDAVLDRLVDHWVPFAVAKNHRPCDDDREDQY